MTLAALPTGIVTPLVAFVTADGEPDHAAITALIDHQVAGGVAAVLVNGSMGELGNLTASQRRSMVRAVVAATRGRVPVWAGAAGLGTADTVAGAIDAAAEGADAILALPPLFFDYSDSELERHFAAVSSAVEQPILAYDVPPRTPRKLPPALVVKMAAAGTIQGIKDSSGDLTSARRLGLMRTEVPGFKTYLGTEIAIDAAVTLGFDGSVPGLANILPSVGVDIDAAARAGDFVVAEKSQRIYAALLELLSVPLVGGSGLSIAVNAFKAAVGRVLGLSLFQAIPPVTPPDDSFLADVAAVLDPLLSS